MEKRSAPIITTNLRGHMIEVPGVIRKASGIFYEFHNKFSLKYD